MKKKTKDLLMALTALALVVAFGIILEPIVYPKDMFEERTSKTAEVEAATRPTRPTEKEEEPEEEEEPGTEPEPAVVITQTPAPTPVPTLTPELEEIVEEETEEVAEEVSAETEEVDEVIKGPAINPPAGAHLTMAGGVFYFGSQKETWYNLPMGGVIQLMAPYGYTEADYWVREDGCKMLGSYIMVAANLSVHPRGSIIETSLGTALVCDTGSFAYNDPYAVDIAVNW